MPSMYILHIVLRWRLQNGDAWCELELSPLASELLIYHTSTVDWREGLHVLIGALNTFISFYTINTFSTFNTLKH